MFETLSFCPTDADADLKTFLCLFTSSTLTKLSLYTVELNLPTIVNFPVLKSLLLDDVTFLGENLVNKLLSRSTCPMLEKLVIWANRVWQYVLYVNEQKKSSSHIYISANKCGNLDDRLREDIMKINGVHNVVFQEEDFLVVLTRGIFENLEVLAMSVGIPDLCFCVWLGVYGSNKFILRGGRIFKLE
ncbi:hypothetical protein IFM89_024727 [Coptis chinensis]|uniref:Uncharacterized protein n=1 Tax=Coptis chinensis TaxID=261450 RepID=A0A835LFL5_9MAGN|nr:hypothetical protein IFM89_024727 [Coptis chinensis]